MFAVSLKKRVGPSQNPSAAPSASTSRPSTTRGAFDPGPHSRRPCRGERGSPADPCRCPCPTPARSQLAPTQPSATGLPGDMADVHPWLHRDQARLWARSHCLPQSVTRSFRAGRSGSVTLVLHPGLIMEQRLDGTLSDAYLRGDSTSSADPDRRADAELGETGAGEASGCRTHDVGCRSGE